MTVLLALFLSGIAPPAQSETQIEQLAPESAGKPAVENIHKGKPDARVAQLPATLDPIEGSSEKELQQSARPATTNWTAEVLRAMEIIRTRGQQPTPELIAREISPEALQAYLSTNPDLKDPAPSPAPAPQPVPQDVPGQPGVTIVPPKGG